MALCVLVMEVMRACGRERLDSMARMVEEMARRSWKKDL